MNTMLLVVLLLCLQSLVYAESDVVPSPSLYDRVDRLEALLLSQSNKDQQPHHERLDSLESLLIEQRAFLRQQADIQARQDRLLRVQAEKLSLQQTQLNTQAEKLSQQDRVLRRQTQKLSKQENLLNVQSEKLSRQDVLLRVQSEQLFSQEARLSRQEDIIRELRTSIILLQNKNGQSVSTLSVQLERFAVRERETGAVLYDTKTRPVNSSQSHQLVSTVPHDVVARSDDTDPLQTVVNQMDQRLTEVSADIQALKNANTQQDQDISETKSSTFVHWGSSQCSDSSQLVYTGVVGGSHYTQSGAATNYLCLTMSPVLSNHQIPTYLAYLYGGEYQSFESHHNSDAVCSVCRSSYSTTIMIPGTNVCTQGWHRQYSGYLMAGEYDHAAGSEFICVDTEMDSRPGTTADNNGKLLYFTVTRCGSLPCQPYVNNKIVTCVVCSK